MRRLSKFIKYVILIVFVLCIAIPFSGSYSVQSIDDLAYLIVLGIDVGETNTYKVTFQFTMPNSSGGDSPSSETAPTIINSVDAPTLDSAINLMNTYVSKEINLSHCKAVVISEDLAKKGISNITYNLMNKVQIRPSCNIIISKSTAKDFIENVNPSLENLIAKFYEISPTSSEYTGYTSDAKIGSFFNELACTACDPIAMLGFVDTKDSKGSTNFTTQTSSSTSSSGSSDSGSSDSSGKNSEIMGLAVFKSDKLVGELTPDETLYHSLIVNDIESCYVSIPQSETKKEPLTLFVYNKKNPKIKVEIINNSPLIHLELNLEAKVLSVDNSSVNMSEEKIAEISAMANQYLKTEITKFLYKTSKEYKADINHFGKYAFPLFYTTSEFKKYNWLDNYQNSFFDVKINTNVESSLLLGGN